jgi:hypothetical protein
MASDFSVRFCFCFVVLRSPSIDSIHQPPPPKKRKL